MTYRHRPRGEFLETRFGRYRVAWIPFLAAPLPGWTAWHVQAVRTDDYRYAVRLTLLVPPPVGPRPDGSPRAA